MLSEGVSVRGPCALSMRGIGKRFGATIALEGVDLAVQRGEIVALLGENGAGKTTLMNILFGLYTADEGEVEIFGRPLTPGRPRAALQAGLGMVHQHFMLAGNLTVLENVVAGTRPLMRTGLGLKAARRRLVSLGERFGLPIDPDARVADLSVGEEQRVEILKALYRDAQILVLDEPTGVLTPAEGEHLFATLRLMAAEGLSVVFISHKLGEVLSGADRVVVLRGGRLVGERATAETDRQQLAELMVGRRVSRPSRGVARPGPVRLQARGLTLVRERRTLLSDASFDLRAGEITGLVGVSGNGQKALADILFGTVTPSAGGFAVLDDEGRTVKTPSRVADCIAAGIGRIPEDRNREGAIGDLTIAENAVLERARDPRFSRLLLVRRGEAADHANHLIRAQDIRGAAVNRRARLLSGGNLQKLILARNLVEAPAILVVSQPTRGLDEGAVAAVHAELIAARDRGAAVLLISEDLEEVLSLADRTMAIHAGRLSPVYPTHELDAHRIGLLMAGEAIEPAQASAA